MIRQRFFSFLNVSGLAVGSACFLLIYLFVKDELSYDKFHERSENIYRVNMTNIWVQGNDFFGSTGPGVAKAIRNDVPDAKEVVRLHHPFYGATQLITITNDNGETRSFEDASILAADSNFHKVFTLLPISGDPETALYNPRSLIMNESTALRYFGHTDVVGKHILIGREGKSISFRVTAVIEDLPEQSHFSFNLLVSMSSFPNIKRRENTWWWTTFVTYILIDEQTNPETVERKLAALPARYNNQEDVDRLNWTLKLQPLESIRLYSQNIPNRLGEVGSIQAVMMFSVVAILILLLSCVNFMNLSTARYADRVKEIGIQKVLGSTGFSLKSQFIVEAMIYSLISIIIGLGLAELGKILFNQISGKSLSINFFNNPELLLIVPCLVVVIGLLAGSYPAWVLTRFQPVDALKGKVKGMGNVQFRNVLVVFQFSISIGLVSIAFLIKDQLHFLKNKDLGFDQEHVVAVPHMEWLGANHEAFMNALENSTSFSGVSYTNSVPPDTWNQDLLQPMGTDVKELSVTLMNADANFSDMLGLKLLAGRNFFPEGAGDLKSVILNESAAINLGYIKRGEDPDKVIGKQIKYYMDEPFRIIGVVRDFHFWALNLEVEPLAIFHKDADMWQPDGKFVIARLTGQSSAEYKEAIGYIESQWDKISGGLPFSYYFIDDRFDDAFKAETRFGKIIDSATFLALFIATLGLTGLITYTTEQRTKEFGIRKVLGATMMQLITLISRDFFKLLAFAMVIGTVASILFTQNWLSSYPIRVPISPMIFILTTLCVVVLILAINSIIVGINTQKNPSTILRDE